MVCNFLEMLFTSFSLKFNFFQVGFQFLRDVAQCTDYYRDHLKFVVSK